MKESKAIIAQSICGKGGEVMTLDERSTMILEKLCHSDTYVPMEEIAERLQVSKRTVYYDLEKINYWLQGNGLGQVEYVRSSGLFLPEDTKKKIPPFLNKMKAWQYYYSEKERRALLAVCLLSEFRPLYLSDLMETIQVSRGTTFKELDKLKQELSAFRLAIAFHRKQGYRIEGTEYDKRKAAAHYFSEFATGVGWSHLVAQIRQLLDTRPENADGSTKPALFTDGQLAAVYQVIEECERDLGMRLTDDMVHHLAFRFLFFSQRLKLEKRVEMDQIEKDFIKSTHVYLAAQNVCERLGELFHVSFPEDEVCYIAINILGAKVNYIDTDIAREEDIALLKTVIRDMVDDFQRYACVFFQNRASMEKAILMHLRPAFYRIRYGLEVQNPLTDLIRQKYGEIFELTKKVIHHLEEAVGAEVGEHEIAFLAMHFGGWMKRQGAQPVARKKALIVCGNGVSTSRLLQAQLESLCSTVDIVGTISRREYEAGDFDVDFIVSTSPIEKRRIPVFNVSPILTDIEKEKLFNQINSLTDRSRKRENPSVKALMEMIKRHAHVIDETGLADELHQYLNAGRQPVRQSGKPSLKELLTSEQIQFARARDWREAIRLAAEPLLRKGWIDEGYVRAMIRNVEELGPYIVVAPLVAIPHAKPEQGVRRLGMSLLRLENSVSFSGDGKHEASLIIVLAAVDQESHLKALSELNGLLSDRRKLAAILQADSARDVLKLIEQNESGKERAKQKSV
jgi:mannitol operon transcriptional antiterminator